MLSPTGSENVMQNMKIVENGAYAILAISSPTIHGGNRVHARSFVHAASPQPVQDGIGPEPVFVEELPMCAVRSEK